MLLSLLHCPGASASPQLDRTLRMEESRRKGKWVCVCATHTGALHRTEAPATLVSRLSVRADVFCDLLWTCLVPPPASLFLYIVHCSPFSCLIWDRPRRSCLLVLSRATVVGPLCEGLLLLVLAKGLAFGVVCPLPNVYSSPSVLLHCRLRLTTRTGQRCGQPMIFQKEKCVTHVAEGRRRGEGTCTRRPLHTHSETRVRLPFAFFPLYCH